MSDGLCEFCKDWLTAGLVTYAVHPQSWPGEPSTTWRSKEELEGSVHDDCWLCVHVKTGVLTSAGTVRWLEWPLSNWFELQNNGLQLKVNALPSKREIVQANSQSRDMESSFHYTLQEHQHDGNTSYSLDKSTYEASEYVRDVVAAETNLDAGKCNPARTKFIANCLRQCKSSHPVCNQERSPAEARFLPKRLLSLTPNVRLVHTASISRDPDLVYATLSHCWGKEPFTVLRSLNLDAFLESVPVQDLEKTFRETIELCIDLGISYLWVDSLCIIQEGGQDWLDHASKMHLVYENAVLNIAACASSAGKQGLTRSLEPMYMQDLLIDVPMTDNWLYRYRIEKRYSLNDQIWDSMPLFQRSWCIQEIFMAPRVVYFSAKQLFWRCQEDHIPEFGLQIPARAFWTAPHNLQATSSLYLTWLDLACDYSTTRVTMSRDRVFALAGLAAWFASRFKENGIATRYAMGCWQHTIKDNLLWSARHAGSSVEPIFEYAADLCIPSWSWLRYSFEIEFVEGNTKLESPAFEVVDLSITLRDPAILYGLVDGVHLLVRSPICSLSFEDGLSLSKLGGSLHQGVLVWGFRYSEQIKLSNGLQFARPRPKVCSNRCTSRIHSIQACIYLDMAINESHMREVYHVVVIGTRHVRREDSSLHPRMLQGLVIAACNEPWSGGQKYYRRIGFFQIYSRCEEMFENHVQPLVDFLASPKAPSDEFYLV